MHAPHACLLTMNSLHTLQTSCESIGSDLKLAVATLEMQMTQESIDRESQDAARRRARRLQVSVTLLVFKPWNAIVPSGQPCLAGLVCLVLALPARAVKARRQAHRTGPG